MPSKSIYKSKTVWFNITMTVIGIAAALQSFPTLIAYAPLFAAVLAIGNVILRIWFTDQPIQ